MATRGGGWRRGACANAVAAGAQPRRTPAGARVSVRRKCHGHSTASPPHYTLDRPPYTCDTLGHSVGVRKEGGRGWWGRGQQKPSAASHRTKRDSAKPRGRARLGRNAGAVCPPTRRVGAGSPRWGQEWGATGWRRGATAVQTTGSGVPAPEISTKAKLLTGAGPRPGRRAWRWPWRRRGCERGGWQPFWWEVGGTVDGKRRR